MYRNAVISFIDLLGFKNIISSSSHEDVLRKLKTVRRLSGEDDNLNGEGLEPKIIQFSDSIIRIRPLDSKLNKETPYGLMFYEMLDLVHMQGELINHGICMRGGVTIGSVHFDDTTLFGPGFVRAYELESTYANYPRIVVDPALIEAFSCEKNLRSSNLFSEDAESIRKMIAKGDDGIYYIDYLNAFLSEVDDEEDIPTFLGNHKELILKNAPKESMLSSISAKYLWLANYHNKTIAKIREEFFEHFGLKKEDFHISSDELPILRSI